MSGWALLPTPQFARSVVQFHWRLRGTCRPSNWWLALGVYPSAEVVPVGGIDLDAIDFARARAVSTGWWLLPEVRGRGLGKEALAAMLHLAFDGLGARQARSIVHPENEVSLPIGRALGYSSDSTEPTIAGDGKRIDAVRLVLHRERWVATRRDDISTAGLSECAEMFGL